MKIKLPFLFLILIVLYSCKKDKGQSEIEKTWSGFLEVLEQKDKNGFRNFSGDTIRCYLCLENTEHERKVLEFLRENDSAWYDKIYDEKIFIPINKFIEEDFDLFSDEKFVEILKNGETVFSKRELDEDDPSAYEVLVTTTEPNIFGHEGGQHTFQFRKINEGYKLAEISTVP